MQDLVPVNDPTMQVKIFPVIINGIVILSIANSITFFVLSISHLFVSVFACLFIYAVGYVIIH